MSPAETAARNALLVHTVEPALTKLMQSGVEVMVLKGAALLGLVYRPHERPMEDVDVLVRGGRPDQLLRELGWQRFSDPKRPISSLLFHEHTYVGPHDVLLDVHETFDARNRWTIDYAGIWERALPHALGGLSLRRPSNEDMLLHHAIHVAKDECAVTPGQCEDLKRLLALPLDWDALVRRARAWGSAHLFWLCLSHAQGALEASVPASALLALEPPRPKKAYLLGFYDLTSPTLVRRPHWFRRRQLALRFVLPDSLMRSAIDAARVAALLGADVVARPVVGKSQR